jgi:Bacterial protein of unknown function (DUF839)
MQKTHPILAGLAVGLLSALTFGQSGIGPIATPVSSARPRQGHPSTRLASGFKFEIVAQGEMSLENPSGVITNFGFLNDFPPQPIEATKTEPDENTYLVFEDNPGGPTAGFDYGQHFLFQGHENSHDLAYITRVNLDVSDLAHRITLLTRVGNDGLTHLNSIDGSTYDPFTKTLLFTMETGFPKGGVVEVSTGWPATVTRMDGILGSAGFEGIHPDNRGNLLIIEDAGGTSVNVLPSHPDSPKVAKQPNSFVYRFVPNNPANLSEGGKLQALQVLIENQPVVFNPNDPVGDVFSEAQLKLHTLGSSYPVEWVTVHDTDVDGTDLFDANTLAKAVGATPFKRPENAQFLPGSNFRTFFFDPTGDTNALSGEQPELAARGVWGSIFRVDLSDEGDSGKISIFVLGDAAHASFDNLTFADANTLLAAEDRGDTLHGQLNRLDSVWAFFLDGSEPRRFVALGRDTASQVDAEFFAAGTPEYQNEGDNEPTGLHVSRGSTAVNGMPGTLSNLENPRAFLTRQHGDNVLWEIKKSN